MHGLYAGDRDRVALGDQIGAQALPLRHELDPWIGITELGDGTADREVGRRDPVQVLPGQRERHWDTRPNSRTVGADHRGPARPGRVKEDLADTVVLDEGGGGERWIDPLSAGGDIPGGGRGVFMR